MIKDFESNLKDLDKHIKLLIDLTDNLKKKEIKVEVWKNYLEVLLVKFTLHSLSFNQLLKGTNIKVYEKEFLYPDIATLFLIERSQIETYLTFYYLNIQPESYEEGQFRFLLFELSGLSSRQKFDVSTNSIYHEKKENEKKTIEILINKINSNIFFQNLTKQQRLHLLKERPAKIIGWEKLIIQSHLNTEIFLPTWKLYSNYAHSEMNSLIQLKTYFKKRDELNNTLNQILIQEIMLVSILIKDLVKLSKSIEEVYNEYPQELKNNVDFFQRIGTYKK